MPDIPTEEKPSQMPQQPVPDRPLEIQEPRRSGRLRRPPRRYLEECCMLITNKVTFGCQS